MLGLAIILLFNLLGLVLQSALHLPIPANVVGLVLLWLALATRLVKLEWVEAPSLFLLRHMMLFFVPLIIAGAALWPVIKDNWLALAGGMVVSVLLTMAVTGGVAQWLARRESGAEPPEAPRE